MKIRLPELKTVKNLRGGEIIKTILRHESVDAPTSTPSVPTAENRAFLSYKGEQLLILGRKPTKSEKSQYRYIIFARAFDLTNISATLQHVGTSWIKHPLLTKTYLKSHTKDLVYSSWRNKFQLRKFETDGKGLRIPQVGALYAIESHWSVSDEPGIVVLPTGTGKTDTMVAAMVLSQTRTILIIVPTVPLREQLSKKFAELGILPDAGIVDAETESPIVGIIHHGFKKATEIEDFFSGVNVVVSTMSALAATKDELAPVIAGCVSHLFIDEAHHTPADSWKKFKSFFRSTKILLFTATPFRNDGKKLEGKIIYNFPLKRAQELEYFRPINFTPIHQFDQRLADQAISDTAIKQLEQDLAAGYDHILMVRVNKITRAEELLPLYNRRPEFNPVLVHSGITPKSQLKQLLEDIVAKKSRIIICVDMLGEGFDLPELKIAAFHDTKKSLTITLQLAGRFTRVKENLGPATFIANTADPEVHEDLEDLYYRDADWNALLPEMSFKMSLEQEDFRSFMEGFKGFPEKFPIQSIRHPLSTIIFKLEEASWTPLQYKAGIKGIDEFQYVYSDLNKEADVLIVILGKRSGVKWAKVQDFESVEWNMIIAHFDREEKLLYIHASNTNSHYQYFAAAIATNPILITGQTIFRCFHNINRIRLHNVGVREPLGRAINYIMRVGSDIKTALKDTEIKKAIKSNVFGVGFENGQRVTMGCSHNGRLWSMRTNNILTWMNWCKRIAKKVTDESIDPDLVLKGTLIPQEIGKLPAQLPFSIEWPDKIFREEIGSFYIQYKNEEYPIWNCDITLGTVQNNTLEFRIELPSGNHAFQLTLSSAGDIHSFSLTGNQELMIYDGSIQCNLSEFLSDYPPLIYFADGSFLEGNYYTKISSIIPAFSMNNFQLLDWEGINLKRESQGTKKDPTSIQHRVIRHLIEKRMYDIIMDDDGKGEVADIVAMKVQEETRILAIDFYHCKYSGADTPGKRLTDFYEVCGQAQRSIKWMEDIDEIFKHLGRRNEEQLRRSSVTRFETGDVHSLDILRRRARKDLKVRVNVFIVQPGLAFSDYDEDSDISKLLAVVETYLKETWNAELRVIASE